MSTEKEHLYLKPNVVIEPLVNRWYAWPHLISPATAAMNVVGRHLKIMDNYIKSPHIHESAVKNPKMLGGPFMDFPYRSVEEIKQLKEHTTKEQASSVALADAISALDELLKHHKKGYSLEPLYEEVPDILKGYVELVYDLNDNPSFRFFESLLYRSEYYDETQQSIALWVTENDERPFCLSTPRLDDPNVLHLNIPFRHNGIDKLSKMKRQPGTLNEIAEELGVKEHQMELFKSFFSTNPYPKYEKYEGPRARMRYFGHACILVETKDVSILIDPVISYYGYQSSIEHFSDIDLPEVIDYVLITHNHQDHILFETLLPLRHKIKNIIVPRTTNGSLQDPNLKLMFNKLGFDNVIEIDELEEIPIDDGVITGIPFIGEHCDLNIKCKMCFHVRIGKFTLLFVADSRIIEGKLYERIHQVTGDVDVVFLGMECEGAPLTWLYGPLLTHKMSRENDQSRRLSGSDFKSGINLINTFNPKEAYVYAMGQEPWLEFISSLKYTKESHPIVQSNMLVEECTHRGIMAERLYGEKELFYNYKPTLELQEA